MTNYKAVREQRDLLKAQLSDCRASLDQARKPKKYKVICDQTQWGFDDYQAACDKMASLAKAGLLFIRAEKTE